MAAKPFFHEFTKELAQELLEEFLNAKKVTKVMGKVELGTVPKNHTTPCILWKSDTDPKGYARVYGVIRGKRYRMQGARLCMCFFRQHMYDTCVHTCHTCSNPLCVSPLHTYPGSPKHNQEDETRKKNNQFSLTLWEAAFSDPSLHRWEIHADNHHIRAFNEIQTEETANPPDPPFDN